MAHVNLTILLSLSLLLGGCGSIDDTTPALYPNIKTNIDILDKADQKEASIIDGDTIDLYFDGKSTRIRLIGIDAFESRKNNKAYRQAYENNITIQEVVARGKRAKEYIKAQLSKRVNLYLEYDETFLDRYDRTLAYLWFDNTNMLNMKLICDGYVMPLTIKPNDKYATAFQSCYEEAKASHKGVWK